MALNNIHVKYVQNISFKQLPDISLANFLSLNITKWVLKIEWIILGLLKIWIQVKLR